MKVVAKKSVSKSKAKTKKKNIFDQQIIIKKTFDKVVLIPHPITEPNKHPNKFNKSHISVHGINGIGENKYFKFSEAGIETVEEFVDAGLKKICEVLGLTEKGGLPIYLRGLALHQNRLIKIKPLKLVSSTPIYLDIETDSSNSVVWMIGLYITKTNEFIQLVADKPKGEPKIIKQCLEILSSHPNEQIIHYGSFDKTYLTKRFREEKLEYEHLIFDNIYNDLLKSLALPINSYTLGDVCDFFGYKFQHPFMDGREVAMLYSYYSDGISKYRGFKKLCEYNEDDVKSLFSLVDHLYPKGLEKSAKKSPTEKGLPESKLVGKGRGAGVRVYKSLF